MAEELAGSGVVDRCENCGGVLVPPGPFCDWARPESIQFICTDCGWPEGKPVPPGPLCSICRRHHGPEVKHERE